ncbi:DUF3391 domain-containing protein [Agrobacterium tumefaciens]|uniref:DUF3391 domain-containing protein n=1 Tax=Agrobacterium tumefaciens TaxID=358 RepID=UPI0015720ACF|nr:DUF3391 domain-containing protein [Agrobacterium tumefaciens]NTD11297.1 DUF3391 domain-containing protein [Agrobacterium tumefaciens]
MLKRIKPKQVSLGMLIEAIDGTWKGQPFWRSRFLLNRPEDVEALKASGVKKVIINMDDGTDAVIAAREKI